MSSKYRATLKVFAKTVPQDFAFISAEIVMYADNDEDAERYAEEFLFTYNIGVYAEVDEVTKLS